MVSPFHFRLFLPVLFLLGLLGCQGEANAPAPPKDQTTVPSPKGPDAASDATWTHSADGRVAIRVWAAQKSLDAKSPIVLIAEIENRGLDSRTFLRPCADELLALTTGVELVGPQGKLPYQGPTFCGPLGAGAYVELASGETVRDELTLPVSVFPQSDRPGLYTIQYRYISVERTRPPGIQDWNLWIGEAPGAPIEVTRQ